MVSILLLGKLIIFSTFAIQLSGEYIFHRTAGSKQSRRGGWLADFPIVPIR